MMMSLFRLLAIANLRNIAAQSVVGNSTTGAPSQAVSDTTSSPIPLAPTMAPSFPAGAPSQAASNTTSSPIPLAPTMAPLSSSTLTYQPSISLIPTTSVVPSEEPTFPPPTVPPDLTPTGTPTVTVFLPTSQPSKNETIYIMRPCSQTLTITQDEEFDEIEKGIYSAVLEGYTDSYGYNISGPFIVTECDVTDQQLAGGRKKRWRFLEPIKRLFNRNLQSEPIILLIYFNMMWSSRYGYDLKTYPSQFQKYMNSNKNTTTSDMQRRFLPVKAAGDVLCFNTDAPTISVAPTRAPIGENPVTLSPIGENETLSPTVSKSSAPTITPAPTTTRSPVIVIDTPKPTREDIVDDGKSFVVGLAAGLSGAVLIVLLFIVYTKRKIHKRKMEEGFELEERTRQQGGLEMVYDDNRNAQIFSNDKLEDGTAWLAAGATTQPMDIMSNPSMVSEGGSLGSNPNDIQEGVPVEQLQDEFDNYKNQDLEFMRNGVEESVYGAEGMMSLAMTRALMEEEDENIDWGGAQDCASMEANIFCDANDWLRKNDNVSLERR